MLTSKRCKTCQNVNPVNAEKCVSCGASFTASAGLPELITEQVPDELKQLALPASVPSIPSVPPNSISFVVAGHDSPMFIDMKAHKTLFLGRHDYGDQAASADFTDHDGVLMGVSRQHARITRTRHGYELQDMGSTNGSWLNKTPLLVGQLYKLKSGDLLQLGQLVCHVYFQAAERSDIVDHLWLQSTSTQAGLDMLSLEHVVVPYLHAIVAVQNLYNNFQSNTNADVLIHTINMGSAASVHIELENGMDAVEVVRRRVLPWRQANADQIERLRALKIRLKTNTSILVSADVSPNTNPDKTEAQSLAKALQLSESRLSAAILEDWSLDPSFEKGHRALLPLLHVLASSALHPMSNDSPS